MKIMFTGIGLNLLYAIYLSLYIAKDTPNYTAQTFIYIIVCCWLISAVGGILTLLNHRTLGVILVIFGSIIFIPLSFITIFGASRVKVAQ